MSCMVHDHSNCKVHVLDPGPCFSKTCPFYVHHRTNLGDRTQRPEIHHNYECLGRGVYFSTLLPALPFRVWLIDYPRCFSRYLTRQHMSRQPGMYKPSGALAQFPRRKASCLCIPRLFYPSIARSSKTHRLVRAKSETQFVIAFQSCLIYGASL